jgi:short-subunit dehydrogenase
MRVFITGASSGIGAALARLYGARGATLGLLARREAALREVAQSTGAPCEIYPCDVRDFAAVKAAGLAFMAARGVPDLVIADAGISHGTYTDIEEDVAVFRDILDINVLGMVHAFHPFVAPMQANRAGRLVGIASVAGVRGLPGVGAYSASKAAAVRYLEALRVELRASGVGVTTICPGYVVSPMTADNPYRMPFIIEADDAAQRIARLIDAGRSYAVVPWQMAIVARLMALLPNALFDRLAQRAGRKPRRGPGFTA